MPDVEMPERNPTRSPTTQPFVSVVIPTFNGSRYLERFLPSVLATTYTNFEIIVVDDGSTDSTEKTLQGLIEHYAHVRVVRHPENLGLAHARNTGVSLSKADFVAFLDNDIEVDPNWLTELVDGMLTDPSVGVAMSLTHDLYLRDRLQCAGQKILPYIGWTVSLGYGEVPNRTVTGKGAEVFACLNAALVRRDVFLKLGGIDVNMTYLWEDIDFEWRVWLSGFKEILVPSSKVFHLAKGPGQRERTYGWRRGRDDFLSRDVFRFMLKNYQKLSILIFSPIALMVLLARAVSHLLKERDSSLAFSTLYGVVKTLTEVRGILMSRTETQGLRIAQDREIFAKVGITDLSALARYHSSTQRAAVRFSAAQDHI